MDYVRWKSRFEPRSPRYGLFFGLGLSAANVHKILGFWGPFGGGLRTNCGVRGPETQRWRPGTGVPSAGLPFQNLPFKVKISLFLPKTTLEPAENNQMKRNSGYSTHATKLPCAEGLVLCVVVPHTHRYHPPKFWPNPKHHGGVVIFPHFARACCYEPQTQRWRPGTGVPSARLPFQNLPFRAKISLFFCPKPP